MSADDESAEALTGAVSRVQVVPYKDIFEIVKLGSSDGGPDTDVRS